MPIEQETDGLALRHRALLKASGLIDRYLQWRRPQCPCCGTDMDRMIPAGYVCFNRRCKAYRYDAAHARMLSGGE